MEAINPREPCPHPPGSAGKVAWLEARAALRLPLFVVGDAGSYARAYVSDSRPRAITRGLCLARLGGCCCG